MTKSEARTIIGSSMRAERHASLASSGSTIAEVNQLLRPYEQMRKMMAQMNRAACLAVWERR
jgi:signal recognition particle GTPase